MTSLIKPSQTKQQTPSLETIRRSLAKQFVAGFVRYTMPMYLMGWCHKDICVRLDHFLDAVKLRQSPRLILCMPPRHGKSELVSRRFPAYVFGRYPDTNVIAASYSADLASRMNRDVQRVMDDEQYFKVFPNSRLPKPGDRERTRTSDMFELVEHKGSYRSAGVGGGITGMGGDILILDDPFKDRAEADSPTIRQKVYDWYTSTFYTRLSPGGGVLVIATRWHSDDLIGRLLEADKNGSGDHWEVVDYPAIATRDEEHRKTGEALHPERYPLKQLLQIKTAIGTRDWEALYQQHPTVEGGAIFRQEWLHFYTPDMAPRTYDTYVMSWDMTFKDGGDTDFAVGQVWGRSGGNYYLIDQSRGRRDFISTLDAFVALSQKHPRAIRKLVEDKANGPAVISALKAHISGIVPVEPDGSKTARAYAVTPLFEAGNVFIPDPAWQSWTREYVDELLQFPSGAHDDQVDATTQALRDMTSKRTLSINIPDVLLRSADTRRPHMFEGDVLHEQQKIINRRFRF